MIRNIMGCLIYIGEQRQSVAWLQQVLQARDRDAAAPTFSPDGLYFLGPRYDPQWGFPADSPLLDGLP
jgi:tRNA pseudouridine38-40 synthase